MFGRNQLIDLRPPIVRFVDRFFLLIILALPFERAFIHDGQGAFLQYIVILFALLSLPFYRRYYAKWKLGIVFYLIFLLVGTFSDLRTTSLPLLRLIFVEMRVWIVFYLFIVAYNISRRHEHYARTLIKCLLIFSATVALFSISGIGIEEHTEGGVEGARMEVMGANLNGTARDVSIFIFFAFLLFANGIKLKWSKKLVLLLLSGASFFALLRTGSRGGLLAMLCALPFVVFTTRNITKKVWYTLALTLALIVMVLVVLNTPTIMDRLNKAYYEGDTGGREGMFYLCLELWQGAKICGHGCFAYAFILGPAAKFGDALATHCTYTYAFMAAGAFGGLFYYLALINIVWNAVRIRFRPYGNLLLLIVVMALLGGITMNIELTKWLYIVYGIILGYADLERRERRYGPLPPVLR